MDIDVRETALSAVIEILKQPEYNNDWVKEVTGFVNGIDADEVTDEQVQLVDAEIDNILEGLVKQLSHKLRKS